MGVDKVGSQSEVRGDGETVGGTGRKDGSAVRPVGKGKTGTGDGCKGAGVAIGEESSTCHGAAVKGIGNGGYGEGVGGDDEAQGVYIETALRPDIGAGVDTAC